MSLDATDLKDDEIDSAIDVCYDIYRELGGNDKVAKGTDYLEKVKEKLKTSYDL